ncbi:patatin-like protein [Streptomyces sp. NRRL B-1677]|uniref:patatin-like protein n=1 Tax=Streptomyces sp. NRRL B-1677 TaxID=2682966 RepID=UPI0018929A8D|nr:patatin-like protein [Streptomyces sp. NRRL B-1677]MBF6047255.1 patatin-like protein [Streptomyces sp. NRRL B-1677]
MTDADDIDRQDIRVAVVMNGGVSLAVWIGGVAVELHHLAMARRWDQAVYRPLLDLLHADARVDVIAGTSAGGLNGAFLALGLARERDIGSLCGLWRDKGDLAVLLQDPLRRRVPSLLKGDYFLDELRNALRRVLASPPPAGTGGEQAGDRPVELILTGTLWHGRKSSFSDDMGVRITEADHDARFLFAADGGDTDPAGDLHDDTVVDRLAVAARCSSSFPAAFAPQWVAVSPEQGPAEGPWPSTAGRATFRASQHVVDGGILLNKPVRPALEAVYRRPAQLQVRRLLTYVVPDPAEEPATAPSVEATSAQVPSVPGPSAQAPSGTASPPPDAPSAPDVLLGVLTRLRTTDSVSRELTEIQDRNRDVRQRRRARDRLASALTATAGTLSEAAWQGYVESRVQYAAETIARWIAAGQPTARAGRWSERQIADCLRRVLADRRTRPESFIPRGESTAGAVDRTGAEWDWGQTTVRRLRDITVDVLKRAVWLAPTGSPQRAAIVAERERASEVFKDVQADWSELEAHWSAAGAGLPSCTYDGLGRATPDSLRALAAWLRRTLADRDGSPEPGSPGFAARRERSYAQARALAGCLENSATALRDVARTGNAVVDPDGTERARLRALTGFLLGPGENDEKDENDVLPRMLRLEVVQEAYGGAHRDAEQEVELVQVSSHHPDLLTGKQLHHFGAFYRASWRVNDWIHGRLDGAAHLVRILLSAERLRQVWARDDGAAAGAAADRLVALLRDCAVDGAEPADRAWLEEIWRQQYASACQDFVRERIVPAAPGPVSEPEPVSAPESVSAHESVSGPEPVSEPAPEGGGVQDDPRLGLCVEAVTHALHTRILRQELPALADAVRAEGDGRPAGSTRWLAGYDAATAGAGATGRTVPPTVLWQLWESAHLIGSQRIGEEAGGDLLATTAAQAAAVTAGALGTLSRVKAVGAVLGALRGYTLAVWAMVRFLTRPDNFGNRVVQLTVAAGAVLLAVSLFVPGLPVVFTLAGVLLLLAGWSAAALLTRETRRVGRRLALVTGFVVLVAAGYVYTRLHDPHAREGLWSLAVKLGAALLVVLLGVFLARTPEPRAAAQRRRNPPPPA